MMKKIIALVITAAIAICCLTMPVSASSGVLRIGSRGNDVYWLEKQLSFLGYDIGKSDSYFDKDLENAVRQYQKDNSLSYDGVAGPGTNSHINGVIKNDQLLLISLGFLSSGADGLPGTNTANAVKEFQKSVGLEATGICDGTTANALLESYNSSRVEIIKVIEEFERNALENWTLPLEDSFGEITGSRVFGAARSGRYHAAVDFVAPEGTPVYAVTDGQVIQTYLFYEGTDCVEVLNSDGSILRYCEISPSVTAGQYVSQGDLIGKLKMSSKQTCMLHLECYKGDNYSRGANLNYNPKGVYTYVLPQKYLRRPDLLDPTFITLLPKFSEKKQAELQAEQESGSEQSYIPPIYDYDGDYDYDDGYDYGASYDSGYDYDITGESSSEIDGQSFAPAHSEEDTGPSDMGFNYGSEPDICR